MTFALEPAGTLPEAHGGELLAWGGLEWARQVVTLHIAIYIVQVEHTCSDMFVD